MGTGKAENCGYSQHEGGCDGMNDTKLTVEEYQDIKDLLSLIIEVYAK